MIAMKQTPKVNAPVKNASVVKHGQAMIAPLLSLVVERTAVAMELATVKEIVTASLDGMHPTALNRLHARWVVPTEGIAFSANANAVLDSLAMDANSTRSDAMVSIIATTTESALMDTQWARALVTDSGQETIAHSQTCCVPTTARTRARVSITRVLAATVGLASIVPFPPLAVRTIAPVTVFAAMSDALAFWSGRDWTAVSHRLSLARRIATPSALATTEHARATLVTMACLVRMLTMDTTWPC